MNEFEVKDYAGARSYADGVKKNAYNIMMIFDELNKVMSDLYGSNWESAGADEAKARYDEIRQNYQVFYDKVYAMKDHIDNVTAAYEEADTSASQTIASI